jgi:hypothetical protein
VDPSIADPVLITNVDGQARMRSNKVQRRSGANASDAGRH